MNSVVKTSPWSIGSSVRGIASYVGSAGRTFMTLSSFVGYTASDWVNRQCKRYVPTAKAEPSQHGLRQRPGRLRAQGRVRASDHGQLPGGQS